MARRISPSVARQAHRNRPEKRLSTVCRQSAGGRKHSSAVHECRADAGMAFLLAVHPFGRQNVGGFPDKNSTFPEQGSLAIPGKSNETGMRPKKCTRKTDRPFPSRLPARTVFFGIPCITMQHRRQSVFQTRKRKQKPEKEKEISKGGVDTARMVFCPYPKTCRRVEEGGSAGKPAGLQPGKERLHRTVQPRVKSPERKSPSPSGGGRPVTSSLYVSLAGITGQLQARHFAGVCAAERKRSGPDFSGQSGKGGQTAGKNGPLQAERKPSLQKGKKREKACRKGHSGSGNAPKS